TVISKRLEHTELDTAMSPRPLRATITLVMRSGTDVPAARMVRPIISSEMPMVSPTYKHTNPCICKHAPHTLTHTLAHTHTHTHARRIYKTCVHWISREQRTFLNLLSC